MSGEAGGLEQRILEHPTRRRLIEALWHSSEPLSGTRFSEEYTDGAIDAATATYHLIVLHRAGVVKVAANSPKEERRRLFVLGGENVSEALRQLGLGSGPSK